MSTPERTAALGEAQKGFDLLYSLQSYQTFQDLAPVYPLTHPLNPCPSLSLRTPLQPSMPATSFTVVRCNSHTATLPVHLLHLLFLLHASHYPIPVIPISQDVGASHHSASLRFPRHLLKGGRCDVGQGVTHCTGDAGGQIGHPRPFPMALDALGGE